MELPLFYYFLLSSPARFSDALLLPLLMSKLLFSAAFFRLKKPYVSVTDAYWVAEALTVDFSSSFVI